LWLLECGVSSKMFVIAAAFARNPLVSSLGLSLPPMRIQIPACRCAPLSFFVGCA
jgi:hypothetical protein